METAQQQGQRLQATTEDLQAKLDDLGARLREVDTTVRRVCREHPLAVLFGAMVAGFAVGRLVARR